jgi:signal transduction histidine kinase
MERGLPILCQHSGPAEVRWVKEPPLRLEAYAMHCAVRRRAAKSAARNRYAGRLSSAPHCAIDQRGPSPRRARVPQQPRNFPKGTIRLLQTFAAQSVLAIQNGRLFREIEDKSRLHQLASEHNSQFVASMSHELRTTEMMVKNAARFGTEKAQEPLQRVNRAGTHLLASSTRCSTCPRSRQESSNSTHKPCS